MTIVQSADALLKQLVTWRRHLHKYPELSFQEKNTAKFIVQELSKIDNLKIEKNVGGYGVVATLSNGEGPTIALRGDIDALPIEEMNEHSFVSANPGVMHACGHDAHTAMLLGAVHLLAEQFNKKELKGTVKFIFQPAEEATDEHGLTGAPYMIEAGVLNDVDAIIALHVCPWELPGVILMNDGYSMANIDNFEVTLQGSGGHGGYPHLAVDPLWILGSILQSFYGSIGRRFSPLDVVAASIGRIEAGEVNNVIPSEVTIEGTLRSYTPEAREQLVEEVGNIFEIANTLGGSYEFILERGEPALNNNKEINQLIKKSAEEIYPNLKIEWEPFGLGGEDFAHMTKQIPGSMFFLGCAHEDGLDRDLHTPIFDIDENCLSIGTAIFVSSVNNFLNNPQ